MPTTVREPLERGGEAMTPEEKFEIVVLERIKEAQRRTGHSFYGLLQAIEKETAVVVARRFLGPRYKQDFQDGLIELKKAGLLHLSVEQTIIDFYERGLIFSTTEAHAARVRLQLVTLLVH